MGWISLSAKIMNNVHTCRCSLISVPLNETTQLAEIIFGIDFLNIRT